MQKNYLIAAFEQTAAERFPAQGPELLAAMHRRIEALREDNAGASQELWAHLESQIMPGIAIYEVLQTVVSKEEALRRLRLQLPQQEKIKRADVVFYNNSDSASLKRQICDILNMKRQLR